MTEQLELKPKRTRKIKNGAGVKSVQNSYESALFPNNYLANNGYDSVQLSQWTTLFKNCRWYLVSNNQQLLSEIYAEFGLVQTVVDVPVDDAFRGGIEILTKQLDEDEIKKLESTMEWEEDLEHIKQSRKWNRLYGGAGLLVITDQDPSEPLDIEAIGPDTPLEFRAVDMWEIFPVSFNAGGTDTLAFNLSQLDTMERFNFHGVTVHMSRLLPLKGMPAPSWIRPRLRGWGFSVVEALVRSINQYLKATDLSFEVLDEYKLDIFKFKGLAQTLLSPNGDRKVQKRVATANQGKNYLNSLVLDSEDEYDQKQLSFTGIAEVMAGIRIQVAADLRMPLTKLFGISAAGFNSGEDDIETYNGMIESSIRSKSKKDLIKVVGLRCQQLFGFIPDDLEVKFKPLRIMSSEQEENVKTQKYNRLLSARQAGEITSEEFRDAVNKDNLLPIKLSKSGLLELEESTVMDDSEEQVPDAKTEKSQLTAKTAKEPKA